MKWEKKMMGQVKAVLGSVSYHSVFFGGGGRGSKIGPCIVHTTLWNVLLVSWMLETWILHLVCKKCQAKNQMSTIIHKSLLE
jgi:hypothetical protein